MWITYLNYINCGYNIQYINNINMDHINLIKTVKVGDGLFVNIPKHIRDALFIERGDYLVMAVYEMGTIVLRKASESDLQTLKPKNIQYGTE